MLAKKADSSSATDIISGSSVRVEGARWQLLTSYTDCGPLENKTPQSWKHTCLREQVKAVLKNVSVRIMCLE